MSELTTAANRPMMAFREVVIAEETDNDDDSMDGGTLTLESVLSSDVAWNMTEHASDGYSSENELLLRETGSESGGSYASSLQNATDAADIALNAYWNCWFDRESVVHLLVNLWGETYESGNYDAVCSLILEFWGDGPSIWLGEGTSPWDDASFWTALEDNVDSDEDYLYI